MYGLGTIPLNTNSLNTNSPAGIQPGDSTSAAMIVSSSYISFSSSYISCNICNLLHTTGTDCSTSVMVIKMHQLLFLPGA